MLTKLHVVKVWKICRPTWRQFVYMPILTVWKGRKGFLILKRYNGFSRRLLLVLYSPSPLRMMSYMSAGGAGVATPGRAHCPVPLKLLANAECQLPHLGPADRWTGDWHRACALINSGNVDIFQIFHQNNGWPAPAAAAAASLIAHSSRSSFSNLPFKINLCGECDETLSTLVRTEGGYSPQWSG